ncbi:MAG: hypothetical protein RLZZ384_680, partial [Pseudomonadota bacterium]
LLPCLNLLYSTAEKVKLSVSVNLCTEKREMLIMCDGIDEFS